MDSTAKMSLLNCFVLLFQTKCIVQTSGISTSCVNHSVLNCCKMEIHAGAIKFNKLNRNLRCLLATHSSSV